MRCTMVTKVTAEDRRDSDEATVDFLAVAQLKMYSEVFLSLCHEHT